MLSGSAQLGVYEYSCQCHRRDQGNCTTIPQIQIQTELIKNTAIVRISDNGGGIPEVVQARLFDPLFTTKPVGKGTGLGLSIARQIVQDQHGGTLRGVTEIGSGTVFEIALPISTIFT